MEQIIGTGLRKTLDSHGFSFQHTVLSRIRALARDPTYPWRAVASEFPVTVGPTPVHIDFLLSRRESYRYLVCECKRKNLGTAWCFVKAPFDRQRDEPMGVFGEEVKQMGYGDYLSGTGVLWGTYPRVVHLGLEVHGPKDVQEETSSRTPINDVVRQSLRGMNGLVELLKKHPHLVFEGLPWRILPVVFTTATLWVSSVALDTAELHTGLLPTSPNAESVPWVAYTYHQSPDLKHSLSPSEPPVELVELLGALYVRTVCIVSVSGIESFLAWSDQ